MMVEATSKIGIVSKLAHCKSHLAALTKDGFDVVALGGSPTSIPPSIDVVVVRIESCSHGAHKVALNWSRKTGGRLITENGITGIRRALTATPDEKGYQKYLRAAEMLLRDRPFDSKEQVQETIQALGADLLTANKVVADVFASRPEPTTETTVGLFPEPYPNPAECAWAALVSEERAVAQAEQGLAVYQSLSPEQRETLRNTYLSRRNSSSAHFVPASTLKGKEWARVRDLNGRPHQFFVVLLLCLSEKEPHLRKPLQRAYQTFSGKRTDGRVANAAAWATGRILALERQPSVPSPTGEEPLVIPVDDPPEVEVEEEAELAPMVDFPASTLELEAAADPVVMVGPAVAAEPEKMEYKPSSDLEERMKTLQNDLEGHLLDVMTQASDLKRELVSLTKENATLRAEMSELRSQVESYSSANATLRNEVESYSSANATLRNEVSELRSQVESTNTPSENSAETTALLALCNLKDSLDALRAKGVDVALKLKL